MGARRQARRHRHSRPTAPSGPAATRPATTLHHQARHRRPAAPLAHQAQPPPGPVAARPSIPPPRQARPPPSRAWWRLPSARPRHPTTCHPPGRARHPTTPPPAILAEPSRTLSIATSYIWLTPTMQMFISIAVPSARPAAAAAAGPNSPGACCARWGAGWIWRFVGSVGGARWPGQPGAPHLLPTSVATARPSPGPPTPATTHFPAHQG